MFPQPALLTVREFRRLTGVSNTKTYDLLKSGALERVKIGSATRITRDSVDRWLAALPRTAAVIGGV